MWGIKTALSALLLILLGLHHVRMASSWTTRRGVGGQLYKVRFPLGALNSVKKEYWSPITPGDEFPEDELDVDASMVDDSLNIGMNGGLEEGNSLVPEEYSESLTDMLKEAEENFKRFVDQVKGDGSNILKPITQEGLREFRANAGAGVQGMIDGDLNKALDSFDAAKNANGTQLLLQRGMTLFLLEEYENAASQFAEDVNLMENKNLKLFKATDARLWWSASLRALNREAEAKDALDIYNDELEESRYLMQVLLRYYHGDVPLEELMQVVGDTDDRDVLGNSYYGNFYLALYLTATGEKDMAKAFLDLVCDSGNLDDKDLWRHLPSLLRSTL